jgi:hypothetical protein
MSALKLTEEFFLWCNKVALDGLRRGVLSYPEMIKEREYKERKTRPGVCIRCDKDYLKNTAIQKYCRECHEIMVHERNKRKNVVTAPYKPPVKLTPEQGR